VDSRGNGNSSSAVKFRCLGTSNLMSFKLNSGRVTTIETSISFKEGKSSKLQLNEIKQLGTKITGETIPLQAWTVPEDSRRLRLQISGRIAREFVKVFRRKHRLLLLLKK